MRPRWRRLFGGLLCPALCLATLCYARHAASVGPSAPHAAFAGATARVGWLAQPAFAGAAARAGRPSSTAARAVENPYDVLGLQRGTDRDETRRLFRARALKEHPDVNPDDPEAEERFQRLVNAYNSIMGDELLADELLELRVEATRRYQQELKKELDRGAGLVYMGNARLVQGLAQVAFFLGLLALANSPEALNALLGPPSRTGF